MPDDRPVVFLAFADAMSNLPGLKAEGWSIRDQFEELKRSGILADVIVEERASAERIGQRLRDFSHRIAIFHFGGHADGDRLLLESALEPREGRAEGLATLLGQQRGLKLVFLNGCSTRPQVKRLIDAGVPSVIATARAIDDRVAQHFASAFYQALTTGSGGNGPRVPGGCSLAAAFAQAQGVFQLSGVERARELVASGLSNSDVSDDDGFPWSLHYRKGSEHLERWSLFDDDPLYGLPELPASIAWPVEPYRSLEPFERRHARIFFGRGRAIRDLYNLLTLPAGAAEARLVFYYGQTGVGKTSVLAAGLLPRLESMFATSYCRRSVRQGLLGTLLEALGGDSGATDLRASWLAVERQTGLPLVAVLDQAEEAFTRARLDVRPEEEAVALFEAVRATFDPNQTDRPEGRLILSFRKEWLAEFSKLREGPGLDVRLKMLDPLDLAGVIEAIQGPAGHYGLEIRPDRKTVEPGQTALAEFVACDLFDTLADPSTEQTSPIAPTLQILLHRMWGEANRPERLRGQAAFDRALYQELKSQGFKLDEVIEQQMAAIRQIDGLSEPVEKGLLLDLLEFYTTPQGTADTHTRQQVQARYAHQPAERLDGLLEACQGRYLLVHIGIGGDGSRAYRLTHDTLAPLLRERFRVSPLPAQRARNLLESRVPLFQRGSADDVLRGVDLRLVEEGLGWMRSIEPPEVALLDGSRRVAALEAEAEAARQREVDEARRSEEQARRDKQAETALRLQEQQAANRGLRRRAYTAAGAAAAALVGMVLAWLFAGQAKFQEGIADEKASIAESRRLAALSESVLRDQLDHAMLLAVEAAAVDTDEAREALLRCLEDDRKIDRFLNTPEGAIPELSIDHEGTITARVSLDGQASNTAVLRLRQDGTRLGLIPVEEGDLRCVDFRDDGSAVLGYTRLEGKSQVVETLCRLVELDPHGARRRSVELGEGSLDCVSVGPAGQIAAGVNSTGAKGGARVHLLTSVESPSAVKPFELKEGHVTCLEFSDQGAIAAGCGPAYGRSGDGSLMILNSEKGQLIGAKVLNVEGSAVHCVAHGPDGRIAIGFNGAGGGGVLLLDSLGRPLWKQHSPVPEGQLARVRFSSGGGVAALYTRVNSGGVVLLNPDGGRTRNEPIELGEELVLSMDVTPEGLLAIGTDRGVRLIDTRHGRITRDRIEVVATGRVWQPRPGPGGSLTFLVTTHAGGVHRLFRRGTGPDGPTTEVFRATTGNIEDHVAAPGDTIAVAYASATDPERNGVFLLDSQRQQRWDARVHEGQVTKIAVSQRGKVAVGYKRKPSGRGQGERFRGGVVLLNPDGTRSLPGPCDVPEGAVLGLAYGPDDSLAIVSGPPTGSDSEGEYGLLLLDSSGKRRREKAVPVVDRGRIKGIARGPDGTIAAAFDRDLSGGLQLFDLDGKRLLRDPVLVVRDGLVTGLASGLEGRLAVAFMNNPFRGSGESSGVLLLERHGASSVEVRIKHCTVSGVAFGSDGIIAATYARGKDQGGGVMFIDADRRSCRAKVARIANRNFTRAEWSRFFPDQEYRRTSRTFDWPHDLSPEERARAEAWERKHSTPDPLQASGRGISPPSS
jgi:hypothetical protein